MSTYIVRYEKDETGWWVATVKDVRGCHTQGRTIDQARRRIREALELFVDHADEAAKLQNSTTEAAVVLTEEVGVSVRDAGELLGLSHQRVHQLLTASSRKKKAK